MSDGRVKRTVWLSPEEDQATALLARQLGTSQNYVIRLAVHQHVMAETLVTRNEGESNASSR